MQPARSSISSHSLYPRRRVTSKSFLLSAAGALFAVLLSGVLYFGQDSFYLQRIKPSPPFTATGPAPDYSDPLFWIAPPHFPRTKPDVAARPAYTQPGLLENWRAYEAEMLDTGFPEQSGWRGELSSDLADVFYIHGGGYYAKTHWNAPLDDPQAQTEYMNKRLPNEAGPFAGFATIFTPRYREATLWASLKKTPASLQALDLAYRDVERAFDLYVARANAERPLIMLGYGQGALLVHRLLLRRFHNPALQRRLAAAYLVDYALPKTAFAPSKTLLPPCMDPLQTGCIVAWKAVPKNAVRDAAAARNTSLAWEDAASLAFTYGKPLLCINPLNWKPGASATKDAHKGAAYARGLPLRSDVMPAVFAREAGAACKDGLLRVDSPESSFLRQRSFWGAKWRAPPANLFYADIAINGFYRAYRHNRLLSLSDETGAAAP